jgi:hypothetical protein
LPASILPRMKDTSERMSDRSPSTLLLHG